MDDFMEGPMDRLVDGLVDGRSAGTVLIASASPLFADIVGEMVAECGYTPVRATPSDPAWRVLARTRPCIVICDCDSRATDLQRLLTEVAVRGIPVLLSHGSERHVARALTSAHRLAWLDLPVSRETFRSLLDGLMPAEAGAPRPRPVTASIAGVRIEAAVRVRRLLPDAGGPGASVGRPLARIGHTDELDGARADDDGMPRRDAAQRSLAPAPLGPPPVSALLHTRRAP